VASCTLHRIHRPAALTVERHHIIPQAWQLHDSPALWDPRTVALCPTSHRNVHFWLVQLMHAGAGSDDPLQAKLRLFRGHRLTREQSIAYDALTRYRGTTRSLEALRAAHLYGEA
jgi:hypothetical protein